MTYENLNGTLAGDNVMYLFTYANSVTSGLFVLFVLISFFLVVLISSLIMQQRFTNRMRFEVSLMVASFVTLGLGVILEQVSGLIPPIFFISLIVLTVLSFLWMAMTNE